MPHRRRTGRRVEARPDTEIEESRHYTDEVALEAARSRFGGLDVGASLTGTLVAVALLVILGGLAAAAVGAIAFQTGVDIEGQQVAIGSLAVGLVVLFVAFLVGGWSAGRMARYDGGLNGLMTGIWMLLLVTVFGALGVWISTEYNVFLAVDLPNWAAIWTTEELTTGALVSGLVAVALMLVAGTIGGVLGSRYHLAADATIAAGFEERHVDLTEIEREAPSHLADWTDEELIEEHRMLAGGERRPLDREIELERRGHTLEEVGAELERRGYDPASVG